MCKKILMIAAVAMFAVAIGWVQVARGAVSDLSSVMSELTDHINGSTPLTGPEIEALTSTFESNRDFLDW